MRQSSESLKKVLLTVIVQGLVWIGELGRRTPYWLCVAIIGFTIALIWTENTDNELITTANDRYIITVSAFSALCFSYCETLNGGKKYQVRKIGATLLKASLYGLFAAVPKFLLFALNTGPVSTAGFYVLIVNIISNSAMTVSAIWSFIAFKRLFEIL